MRSSTPHSFLFRNGLSLVLLLLLMLFLFGQAWTGLQVYNDERAEEGQEAIDLPVYLSTPHFRSALFENWESEFLQMACYVLLTTKLYQIGSSESKDPDKDEEVDRAPHARPCSPWPVRKGGWVLRLYSNSLSIALFVLFLLSFGGHFQASYAHAVEEHSEKGQAAPTAWEYAGSHELWFESFQNWQSEFLAVVVIVLLSIWLRQRGSPQSKPVDAGTWQTGE